VHVPAATVNAELGEAKAQSLSYVVLLAATTAISGFSVRLRHCCHQRSPFSTFAIYAALSCLCCIFVWKMVPETKGRTLEQIQQTWSK
jgi:hypothetical protein